MVTRTRHHLTLYVRTLSSFQFLPSKCFEVSPVLASHALRWCVLFPLWVLVLPLVTFCWHRKARRPVQGDPPPKNVRIVSASPTNQKPKWWTTVRVLDTRQDFCRAIVSHGAPQASTFRPQVSWVPGHAERCRQVAEVVWAAGRLVTLYIVLPVFYVCTDWTILTFRHRASSI
jgi:hypothetical protein